MAGGLEGSLMLNGYVRCLNGGLVGEKFEWWVVW